MADDRDWGDAEDLLNIITACAHDLDALDSLIPPAERSPGFDRAIASLRARLARCEQIRDKRYARVAGVLYATAAFRFDR